MTVPYTHFGRAIIRTPAFHYSASNEDIARSPAFKDAIFYASPELFDLWETGKINAEKNTILKYCKRAKSRCTPFGLFSACSHVPIKFGDTKLSFDKLFDRSHFRLDYGMLSQLADSIDLTAIIKSDPSLYLNNTVYHIGTELRFVSYTTDKQAQRHYCLKSYEFDEGIATVINLINRGDSLFSKLRIALSNQGATDQDSTEYLLELLRDKFLVLGEELSTICAFHEAQLFQTLEAYMKGDVLYNEVYKTASMLRSTPIGGGRTFANKLISIATQRFPNIKRNQVFQIDMSRDMSDSCLSEAIVNECLALIPILISQYSGANTKPENKRIREFKESFLKRYDRQTLPLLKVLDPDFGIGYDNELFCWEHSGLLKDLPFNLEPEGKKRVPHDNFQFHIQNEGFDTSLSNLGDDFDWSKYPETMAIFCSLFEDTSGEPIIYLKGIGGASALNTLSRFAYLSEGIENLIANIANFEQKHSPNAKLATIDILPYVKAGNVTRRSMFRERKIALPNYSGDSIPLNELFVSVQSDRIILTDKDGFEVIPCIDNALVYDYSNLSIYKFLGDLQTQDMISSVLLHPFDTVRNVSFIPRISHGRIILHRAEWRIHQDAPIKDVKGLKEYLQRKGTPYQCVIIDGDNELRVDYSDKTDLDLLYSYYKKSRTLKIAEDLLSIYGGVVKDVQGNIYSNEFVIPIHKVYA